MAIISSKYFHLLEYNIYFYMGHFLELLGKLYSWQDAETIF